MQAVQKNTPLDQLARREESRSQHEPMHDRWDLSDHHRAEASKLLESTPDYMDNEVFHRDDAEAIIFDQAPELPTAQRDWYTAVMTDVAAGTRSATGKRPVTLTPDQERAIFLQYNYARFRVAQAHDRITTEDSVEPAALNDLREMIAWKQVADNLRERITELNLGLVLAMSKRKRMSDSDFGDVICEGNMALLRAIDKFDVARGFKFSTYACRSILKAFARYGQKQTTYRQRFPTDYDPGMQRSDEVEQRREDEFRSRASDVREIVDSNEAELRDIERSIIEARFGLNDDDPGMTLEQVGRIVGVTKERVRQLQNHALDKIAAALADR